MNQADQKKPPPIPPWSLPLVAILVVVGVAVGVRLYRGHLERELADVEAEKRQVERQIEDQDLAGLDVGIRCPPVIELDPAWAERMPWGPGREEALAGLDGGGRRVHLMDPSGRVGPSVSWNPRFRLYDLAASEAARRESFYLGVALEDGGWALTLPTNWPMPLCQPWVDCAAGGCGPDGCLSEDPPGDQTPPPARLPEICR